MYLDITPTRRIADLQKEFNIEFPYLTLEFYQHKPGQPGVASTNHVIHNRKLTDVQWPVAEGRLEIKDDMKVADLEKIFKDQFGLAVQVFRRSGNVWLETTMTDHWTLRKQNEHGAEISSEEPKKNISPTDEYDLNRDSDH